MLGIAHRSAFDQRDVLGEKEEFNRVYLGACKYPDCFRRGQGREDAVVCLGWGKGGRKWLKAESVAMSPLGWRTPVLTRRRMRMNLLRPEPRIAQTEGRRL